MSSLPPALNFAETEEEICKKWAAEKTFKTQDKLSLERGDEVSLYLLLLLSSSSLLLLLLLLLWVV
jgi:hypothetical protein